MQILTCLWSLFVLVCFIRGFADFIDDFRTWIRKRRDNKK